MAFDNVTLFEINVEDLPFPSRSDAQAAEQDESERADEGETLEITSADEAVAGQESSGRGRRVVGFLFGAVVLAVVARQIAKRRGGDADEFETAEIEPGVERVEA